MPCRRACDRLTTAKLAIRADDCSLLLHCFGPPHVIVADKLRSYGAAMKVVGNADKQETGRWLNNLAKNSHQPFRRRERAMIRFRRMRTLQKNSLLSTLPVTTISIKNEASPNAITSRPTAPPHSPCGATFVRHEKAGVLA